MGTLIHPSAVVSPEAELEDGVKVGPFCVIESGVRLGAGTELKALVSVQRGVVMGSNCVVCENAVVGGDPQDRGFKGEKSFVRIGNNNVIRENVTINRATGEGSETVVGDSCLIMAGVHIAHNVIIGNGVIIANNVAFGGYATVGDHSVLGGLSGVHQFVHVGSYCMIGGLRRVVKDVPHYTLASGEPLRLEGLNSVGLKRAGFAYEKRREILNFYRELYNRDRTFTSSLKEAQSKKESLSAELQNILSFYESSKRGVTFWTNDRTSSSDE